MTDNFFDIGGGPSAPGALLKGIGDTLVGTVVDSFKKDFAPFGQKDPQVITDRQTGQSRNRTQLVVILQTEYRNWANVSKVPRVDPKDENSPEKPPSEDDGTRAVYIPEMSPGNGHNGLIFAIGQAVQAAKTGGLPNGAKLAIRITELKDTGKGNPLKVYEAQIQPPAAGQDLFAAQAQAAPPVQQAPSAPAPAPVQQAAPAGDPWASQAPSAPAGDPWASQAPAAAPPF